MDDIKNRFNRLKRSILDKQYERMNPEQRKAIFKANGPILILAGAGSGKTTVIVNRIAFLVDYGDAYHAEAVPDYISEEDIGFLEDYLAGGSQDIHRVKSLVRCHPVNPWNILAITFTNKAANELKTRLEELLGDAAMDIGASTFHSACVRILRREITRLGYGSSFTIYDTDDSVRVLKECLSELNINDKAFPPKSVLHEISRAKDRLLSEEDYSNEAGSDFRKTEIAKAYARYQRKLKAANALDFDDIIKLTVEIFEQFPDVLEYYQNRYKYILVDEYQDTNHCQYRLVSLLSRKHKNLCVVGDDDQSIYKFRGATIENILSFEEQFTDATVIRLEQNYRSTQTILDAANAVIQNNTGRKGKNLWTSQGSGDQVKIQRLRNETEEAEFVANIIQEGVESGMRYSDFAILYRINAQFRGVESYFAKAAIPYRVFGGTRFYDRKEIKDIIAYMSIINNPNDTIRLKRIINEPKRGIGNTTIDTIQEIADGTGMSFMDIMKNADTFQSLARKTASLQGFVRLIEDLQSEAVDLPLDEFFDSLLEATCYIDHLISKGPEGQTRIENVQELKTNIINYSMEADDPSLSGFLEEVALYTDLDQFSDDDDKVTMMTLHSAKGLEFPIVFIVGMEDGIFPGVQSMYNDEELEEERRLAYVGITRAKKKLYITTAHRRMLFGSTKYNLQSRFIKEIPAELVDYEDSTIIVNKSPECEKFLNQKPARSIIVENVGTNQPMEKAEINFTKGDIVTHMVFGKGMVLNMTPMANDTLVEVRFEKAGIKKIMANFAKLKKA